MVLSSACISVAAMAQTITMVRLDEALGFIGAAVSATAASPEQVRERAPVPRVDRHVGAHARAQGWIARLAVHRDSHRNALHHLDPVAAGVLRRKDGELRAARRRDRPDVAL